MKIEREKALILLDQMGERVRFVPLEEPPRFISPREARGLVLSLPCQIIGNASRVKRIVERPASPIRDAYPGWPVIQQWGDPRGLCVSEGAA